MDNENIVVETTTVAERMDTLIEDILQRAEFGKRLSARKHYVVMRKNTVHIHSRKTAPESRSDHRAVNPSDISYTSPHYLLSNSIYYSNIF